MSRLTAAIARSAAVAFLAAAPVLAQNVLPVIGHLTTALGDNDAAEAMSVFDPSCPQYDTIRGELSNLVGSYLVTNEVTVSDEDDKPDRIAATLDWTLTLRSQATDQTVQRNHEVHVQLAKKAGAWRIISFVPASLFSPQM